MKSTFLARGRILIGQASLERYRIRMQNLIEADVFLGTVQNLLEAEGLFEDGAESDRNRCILLGT